MGQGLAGLGGAAGGGAALERLLARRFQEQQAAAQQQAAQERAAQEQQRIALEARRIAIAERPTPEPPVNMQINWQSGQAFNPRTGGVASVPGFTPRPIEPPSQPPLQVDWQSGQSFNPASGQVSAIPGFQPRPISEQQQQSLDLRRALGEGNLELRRDLAAERQATAQTEAANKRRGIVSLAQETSGVLDQLLTPEGELQPGVSGITGRARVPGFLTGVPGIREAASFVSGGDVANKQAAFNRLKSRLVVDLIAEMKAQSRTGATGFGQLSTQEGLLLERAAAQLDQAQTEDQVKDVLVDMRTKLNRILQEPAAAGAGPRRVRYDINGNRLPD